MVQNLSEYLYVSSRQSNNGNTNNVKWYYIVLPVVFAILVVIIVLVTIRKRRSKRRQQKRRQTQRVYVIPDIHRTQAPKPNVPAESQYRRENSVYIVPYTALPLNFDFTSPKVQVHGDYVVLQDLGLLESQRAASAIPIPGNLEEYQQQQPYNPSFYA